MDGKVMVHHYRVCVDEEGTHVLANMRQIREEDLTLLPHGGMTEVVVLKPDTEEVIAEGVAYCNPRDTYNKKLGREIALGRARKYGAYPKATTLH